MSRKLMHVTVKGDRSRWGFAFYGDPKYIPDWRADGLEVYEIENTVPAWVVRAGLVRAWCLVQDVFNFRSPWRP